MKQAGKEQKAAQKITLAIAKSNEYTRFMDAVNNANTKVRYEEMFGWFVSFAKVKTPADLLKVSNEKAEDRIIDYIRFMKSDKIAPSSMRTRLAPIILFYEQNRKPLAWKMIKRTIPKAGGKSKDRGYSREEMKKLLSIAKIREQALIPLFASTGMRRGAPPTLRIRNLVPRDEYKIYEIVVYEGEAEEYHTYTTPEARAKIDDYLAFRQQYGETLTPDSFLFRKEWNLRDEEAAKNPEPITEKTISEAFDDLAIRSGIRVKKQVGTLENNTTSEIGSKAGRVRYEQKLLHGIRKFFETALLDAGFSETWLDMIEGHKLKGLRENYYRPKDDTVLLGTTTSDGKRHNPGYLELMGELVINDEARLKVRVTELKTENTQLIDLLQTKIAALERANETRQVVDENIDKLERPATTATAKKKGKA